VRKQCPAEGEADVFTSGELTGPCAADREDKLPADMTSAQIAGYPHKPIRLIVPFPPGGSTGYTASILAGQLPSILGQPVGVETHAGKFGINALQELVGKSDGHTLMVGSVITNSMTPLLYRDQMTFDYGKEIVPVTRLADFPLVVMVHVSVPADTVGCFLAYQKQNSGKLRFGTDFLGSPGAVDFMMLGRPVGLKVSYRATNGAVGILNDLVGGKIDIAMLNVVTANQHGGRYKALAVTGSHRLANFPGVPTMAEAGYPGIGTGMWQGLFAARGLSTDIVRLLHKTAVEAMDSDQGRAALHKVNADVATSASPEKFAAELDAEMIKWEMAIPELLALRAE
jgi:tripartite-type tricarboxylate transporter receptor subunit TctC